MLLFVGAFIPMFGQEEWDEEEESEPIKYPCFIGLTLQTLLPRSTFDEKMNGIGYGGKLEFLVNLNQTPWYVGFSSSFNNFGREVLEFQDAEGFDLKWKTNSQLWSSHFKVRFEPPTNFVVQPYLNGQVGFNHFYTASKLVDPEVEEDRILERYVDDKAWGLSYGGSIGLLIPLDKQWLYMLDLRCTYLRGSDSSFYTKIDNVTVTEDTIEAFQLEEAPIDMMGLQIGVLIFLE